MPASRSRTGCSYQAAAKGASAGSLRAALGELGQHAGRVFAIVHDRCLAAVRSISAVCPTCWHLNAPAAGQRSTGYRVVGPIDRQVEHGAQAGRVVLQADGAAVQAGDGGDQAEPQAAAGARAALLQAHETLQRALAVLRRDARAAVADGDLDVLADALEDDA